MNQSVMLLVRNRGRGGNTAEQSSARRVVVVSFELRGRECLSHLAAFVAAVVIIVGVVVVVNMSQQL